MDIEHARVQDLLSYKILDTLPEEDFDGITQLLSAICEMPIAVIGLLDSHRQWFKSCAGIDVTEAPREITFCEHVIKQDEVFVVADTLLDPKFKNHPSVIGAPNIRFYAGFPLKSPRGHNLGTLCMVDFAPRELTHLQKQTLITLGQQVVNNMELRKANMQIRKNHLDIVDRVKTKALSDLITSICHQINNPLAIIRGRMMMVHSKHPEMNDLHNDLKIIDGAVERITNEISALGRETEKIKQRPEA